MAVSVSAVTDAATVFGNLRTAQAGVTFDSSYPTGGEPLTASDFGLTKVFFAVASVKTAGTGAVTNVWYDIANAKLKAYTASAEVSNTTDLSAVVAEVTVFGK